MYVYRVSTYCLVSLLDCVREKLTERKATKETWLMSCVKQHSTDTASAFLQIVLLEHLQLEVLRYIELICFQCFFPL